MKLESVILESVIHSDPDILGGTPVFVGTRVPVQSLFDHLEAGKGFEWLLRFYRPKETPQGPVKAEGMVPSAADNTSQTNSGRVSTFNWL